VPVQWGWLHRLLSHEVWKLRGKRIFCKRTRKKNRRSINYVSECHVFSINSQWLDPEFLLSKLLALCFEVIEAWVTYLRSLGWLYPLLGCDLPISICSILGPREPLLILGHVPGFIHPGNLVPDPDTKRAQSLLLGIVELVIPVWAGLSHGCALYVCHDVLGILRCKLREVTFYLFFTFLRTFDHTFLSKI
jgi:hypothetical protein